MPNYEKIAKHIAENCLRVIPGEHVLISGGIHQYKLLSKIVFHTRKLGAFPHLSVTDDETSIRTLTEVNEKYLLRPPGEHDEYMARLYDAAISLNSMEVPSRMSEVPPRLMGKISVINQKLRDIKFRRKRRTIAMGWPTKEQAKQAGLTYAGLRSIFWKAVTIDLAEMDRLSDALKERFIKGDKVRMTSEKGTDITFSIKGRRVLVDGGYFTPEMVEAGEIIKNLPCGEVYTTAHEQSPEGVVVFDEVYVNGRRIEDLRLEFRQGRVVSSSARSNHEAFHSLWSSASGDHDRIGEFAIGTNPAVDRIIGDPLFDEKVYGSVHLALGENRMYGGRNKSSIHWDFVVLRPTVEIDGEKLLDTGRFTLGL